VADGYIVALTLLSARELSEAQLRTRLKRRQIDEIRQAGIDGDTAEDAVREVFEEVDENALLDRAIERRLRGKTPNDLDDRGRARVVRGLVAQGFQLDAIFKKLKS
jgi:SOS response regulatory protein OraA/RecX